MEVRLQLKRNPWACNCLGHNPTNFFGLGGHRQPISKQENFSVIIRIQRIIQIFMWNDNHEKILQGNFFLLALLFSDFKQRGPLVTHVHTWHLLRGNIQRGIDFMDPMPGSFQIVLFHYPQFSLTVQNYEFIYLLKKCFGNFAEFSRL